ncbi:MAG TPA: hypothetical protein VFT87_04915 [Candidatus Saccharimonadales bacterium]|nr:hypothetical protein [Candidatus Saccharimonadales bacterium]
MLYSVIDRVHRALAKPPKPFLKWPFDPRVEVRMLSGFEYDAQESAIHGEKLYHGGVDLEVPLGTPVYAPCAGFGLATYSEFKTERRLNLATALQLNPREKRIRPEDGDQELPLRLGAGLILQIVRETGSLIQLDHLQELAPNIPYMPPKVRGEDFLPSPALRLPMRQYRRLATWVRAGQLIGYSGMTGCSWGEASCFSYQREMDPPIFTGTGYTYWSNPHVHLTVCSSRAWLTRNTVAFCPYGIGGTVDQYPRDATLRFGKGRVHHSLWKK